MDSDIVLYVLGSQIPEVERLIVQLQDVIVYSFNADFQYALKEIAFNVSKYGRGKFNRVCWVTTPLPDDAPKESKVNFVSNLQQYPEAFFRFLLDIIVPHVEDGSVVDVVEARGDNEYAVAVTMGLQNSEWRAMPRSIFEAHYEWAFAKEKDIVPLVMENDEGLADLFLGDAEVTDATGEEASTPADVDEICDAPAHDAVSPLTIFERAARFEEAPLKDNETLPTHAISAPASEAGSDDAVVVKTKRGSRGPRSAAAGPTRVARTVKGE
jgi:hypothetical protein